MTGAVAVVTAISPARVDELLDADRAEAWRRYLAATQDQAQHRYEEVEPWAWSRLRARLRAIDARAEALKSGAA